MAEDGVGIALLVDVGGVLDHGGVIQGAVFFHGPSWDDLAAAFERSARVEAVFYSALQTGGAEGVRAVWEDGCEVCENWLEADRALTDPRGWLWW